MVFNLEKGKYLSSEDLTVIGKIPTPRAYHAACTIGTKIFIHGIRRNNYPDWRWRNGFTTITWSCSSKWIDNTWDKYVVHCFSYEDICPEPLVSQVAEFVHKQETLYNDVISSNKLPHEVVELIKFKRKLSDMSIEAKEDKKKQKLTENGWIYFPPFPTS